MKKIVLSLLCTMLAFTLAADEKADLDKQLSDLQKERARIEAQLIQQRRSAIRKDKYAAKLAREILVLNQQLSEYLNTKPEIRPMNQNLAKLDRQIRELKQRINDLKKKNTNTK
ncbi:MAG: hypothetical protein IJW23_03925 [Lentisphaeria bacterium]|nr:hypothetical protein [Lentisphaeria bacterium]